MGLSPSPENFWAPSSGKKWRRKRDEVVVRLSCEWERVLSQPLYLWWSVMCRMIFQVIRRFLSLSVQHATAQVYSPFVRRLLLRLWQRLFVTADCSPACVPAPSAYTIDLTPLNTRRSSICDFWTGCATLPLLLLCLWTALCRRNIVTTGSLIINERAESDTTVQRCVATGRRFEFLHPDTGIRYVTL